MNSPSDTIIFPPDTKRLYFGLGWEYIPDNPFDLNLFAAALDDEQRYVGPDSLCFFGNQVALDGALRISPDNQSGDAPRRAEVDEYLLLDARHLPPPVTQVYIGVQIFKAKTRFQNFAGLDEAFLRIKDADDGTLFETLDLDQTIQEAIGAIVGKVLITDSQPLRFEPLRTPLFGDTIQQSLRMLPIRRPKRKKLFGLF